MADLLIIQNVACEGPGMIESLAQKHGLNYVRRRAWEEEVQAHDDPFGALVVLGGPMNVYEEEAYPFLGAEGLLIQQFLESRKPILGICLGAQLLAKALGARVFAGPQKEIGWYPVWSTPKAAEDALFQTLDKKFMAFHWHGDTFELPRGAVHLARSSLYEHQAFRYGDNAYGIQFHLEVTPQMVSEWVEVYSLASDVQRKVRKETQIWNPELKALATHLFERFFNLI